MSEAQPGGATNEKAPKYYVNTPEGVKPLSKEILSQIPATSHIWPVEKLSSGGEIENAF